MLVLLKEEQEGHFGWGVVNIGTVVGDEVGEGLVKQTAGHSKGFELY